MLHMVSSASVCFAEAEPQKLGVEPLAGVTRQCWEGGDAC